MQTSVRQDGCTYDEQLMRSMYAGLYQVNTPSNDCTYDCSRELNPDPYYRFQKYGNSSCPYSNSVDDESSLRRLNYKLSNCSVENYQPGDYEKSGCKVKSGKDVCIFPPTEDTRLSNKACRGWGVNNFAYMPCESEEWYHQHWAIQQFDRNGTNVKDLFKQNHVPCIDTPLSDDNVRPPKENNNFMPFWRHVDVPSLNTPANNYYNINAPPKSCKS